MPLSLITPPSVEPLSVAQAAEHCRVVDAAENDIFTRLITAARRYAERVTGRALINQTWQQQFDSFPPAVRYGQWAGARRNDFTDSEYGLGRAILLGKSPLSSVTSIQYLDTNNTLQTLSSSDYVVDAGSEPGVIIESFTGTTLNQWPPTFGIRNAVTIQYVAGYGAAGTNVPEDLLQSMLYLIGHWYASREEVGEGIMQNVPMAATEILRTYQIFDERIHAFI